MKSGIQGSLFWHGMKDQFREKRQMPEQKMNPTAKASLVSHHASLFWVL